MSTSAVTGKGINLMKYMQIVEAFQVRAEHESEDFPEWLRTHVHYERPSRFVKSHWPTVTSWVIGSTLICDGDWVVLQNDKVVILEDNVFVSTFSPLPVDEV
jgi:hypothetical protein